MLVYIESGHASEVGQGGVAVLGDAGLGCNTTKADRTTNCGWQIDSQVEGVERLVKSVVESTKRAMSATIVSYAVLVVKPHRDSQQAVRQRRRACLILEIVHQGARSVLVLGTRRR